MKLRATALLAALSLAAPAVAQAPGAQQIGQLTLQNVPAIPASLIARQRTYQNARTASFRDWLPDGSILISTRFGDTAQVHRVAVPGAARTQLTFAAEPANDVVVQPGAARYVYARDEGGAEYYQAWLKDLAGGETLITAPGTRNQAFVFSPDGKRLAWTQVTRGRADYDVVMADADRPASRRVVHQGKGAVSPVAFSKDGRTLLLGRSISAAEEERYLLDIATQRVVELNPIDGKIAYGGGEFTPDGRSVVLRSDQGSDVLRLVRMDVATGRSTPISAESRWDVETFDLSDDGRTVAYVLNEDGFSRLVVQSLDGGRAPAQPQLPKGVISGVHFSPDGKRLAFTLSTATSAGDVWSWDLAGAKLARWTESELGGIDAGKLVEPELVRYRSFDGRSIPAFVYRPTTRASGKRPVVIQIHGGPESQELPSFNPRRQSWVADLDAVVITPNVRGSSGYGKEYLALDNAEKREDSVKDIGALLDWIATQPDLDPKRVAVVGQSYGGYMVLACAALYPERLAGIIDLYGISNWTTFLQNTEGYRRDLRRAEYGDERVPAMKAVFDRISPLNQAERMTRPMMVFQGANDPRVPKSESDQLVAKLRGQGTDVWYIVAADEGHGIQKKANAEVVRAAETMFLARTLGVELAR